MAIAAALLAVVLPLNGGGQRSFVEEERSAWQDFVRSLPQWRHRGTRGLNGRGVVIIGGLQHESKRRSTRYTLDALLAVASLRRVGCDLPVEFWHDHDPALLGEALPKVAALEGVIFRNILSLPDGHDIKGFGLSTLVLMHSSFDEVLYLDADVVAVHDPLPLFTSTEYASTGAVFWPVQLPHAYGCPSCRSSISLLWQVLQCEPQKFTMDNSVMLIHRSRHLDKLMLAHFFNLRWSLFYSRFPFFLNGDADMFVFAWLALAAPFHAVMPPADLIGFQISEGAATHFCGHSVFMRHPNHSSELLFAHRARNKFSFLPVVDLQSNSIKRSKNGVVQWQHMLSLRNNSYTCMDFIGHGVQVDESPVALETLTRLSRIEEDMLRLRGQFTARIERLS